MKNQVGKVKIGIILTLDYEIHGNGTGEFENWAYFPTSQMLDLFDEFGAKLTIMAEMGHYWAMKRYEEYFLKDICLFESQLNDAIERGHDVQLHFHPQWIDAKYENGEWHLDFSRKTIERLCHNYDEAYYFLKKGKDELQNLLIKANKEYQCVAFRSGFLQMQPSDNIIKALAAAGFRSDSSVSKGMKVTDSLRSVDYTSAFSKYRPWKTSVDEVCNSDAAGEIIEFPIVSDERDLVDKIAKKLGKIRNGKHLNDVLSGFMAVYGKGMMPVYHPRSLSDRVKGILSKKWEYADFCKLEYPELIRYLKMAISDCNKNGYSYVPVVMIGHSKDFFFSNNLRLFLKSCQSIKEVEFDTYLGAVNKIMAGNNYLS